MSERKKETREESPFVVSEWIVSFSNKQIISPYFLHSR